MWFLLACPAVFMGIIIMVFAVIGTQMQGIETDNLSSFIESRLPYILAVNHAIVFVLLLWVLKKNQLTLRDIGWTISSERLFAGILTGLAGALVFYLFKELVFDSILAWLDGRTPTFTSLFNFHFNSSELPMLIAASSLVFIEESIYRGFGINALQARYSLFAAIIISSIFFGFLHWGNGIGAILYTTVGGLLFAFIYLRTGRNLIPVTIAHVLYNVMIILT